MRCVRASLPRLTRAVLGQVSDGQTGENLTLEEAYGAAPPYGGPVTRAEAREGADPDAVDLDGVDAYLSATHWRLACLPFSVSPSHCIP